MSLFPEPAPSLPPFSTLLITGPYHPSAPIHLAFSSSGPKAPTLLLLCPPRSAYKEEMLKFNDNWLNTRSGTGRNAEAAASVSIFYPPTPVHLSLLLSMFHVPSSSGNSNPEITQKTALAIPPRLVVLVDPSRYFMPAQESNTAEGTSESTSTPPTLSSYLNLVNRVFVSISNFTSGDAPPKFALFDSQLDKFRLPLTIPPPRLVDVHEPAPDDDQQPETIAVFPLVENLFGWVGVFEDDDSYVPSSQGEELGAEDGVRKQLRIYRRLGGPNGEAEAEERLFHWVERRCKSRLSKLEETEFVWGLS